MSSHLRSISKQSLSDRWTNNSRELCNISPFGLTPSGLQDFRGFRFPYEIGTVKTRIDNEHFKDIDVSAGDLSHTVVDNCIFENCLFVGCNLVGTIFGQVKFEKCYFKNTDFRISGIGVGLNQEEAQFISCEFVRPKLKRISFHRVIFRNIDFNGRDWTSVNFGVANFWNCTLRGLFRGCQFQDEMMRSTDCRFLQLKSLGFHNVDLSAAEFLLSGFSSDWVFENVRLPKSGSIKLVKAGVIRSLLNMYPPDSKSNQMLRLYDSIFTPCTPDDVVAVVSKHDLLDLGDHRVATDIFSRLPCEINIQTS